MKFKISTSKLIMLLITTTIIVFVFTLSRYKSTVAMQDTTYIACMADDINFSIGGTQTGYPGSTELVYPIEITNEKDGVICDVTQKFTLEIIGLEDKNIPMQIGLYKDSSCSNLIADNNGLYSIEEFNFKAGIKETKTYYLKLFWPADRNSDFYSQEIDYLKIEIELKQVN